MSSASAPASGLSSPVAVFDAGIGSYALVERIRRAQPKRDIIYFADRARFPYGAKSRDQLLPIMSDTIDYLIGLGAASIVLASNAPSIMVLDALKDRFAVPVYGVKPPLREALAASRSGQVGVMGVRSMIESVELKQFVRSQTSRSEMVALINGSPMVELVESGAFLLEPGGALEKVGAFCDNIARAYPGIDVLTLSSTHLPWLRSFFEEARPGWRFLDPADDVVATLPSPQGGSGRTVALVTECDAYPVAGFREMLKKLAIDLPLAIVNPAIA
ncbi:glutamate racemase [Phyllobacterium leguminum]|uniref:Glutamate racemase n=1 Tax=Phyllobacterium leguminum TaxID=314237 RepID=A0A318T6W9_9HYPH|nr:aspartate/glutamate racemase family protein [Phyllobacterium leguminum]PYE89092.1 glutamate racemase [Phyllobacterium leguminum]